MVIVFIANAPMSNIYTVFFTGIDNDGDVDSGRAEDLRTLNKAKVGCQEALLNQATLLNL